MHKSLVVVVAAALATSFLGLSLIAGGADAAVGFIENPASAVDVLEDVWDDVQEEWPFEAEIPEEVQDRVSETITAVREAIVRADAEAPFLDTGIPENLTDTINALREELLPVAEDVLEDYGIPGECVEDAYNIATGCSADVLQVANQERGALMGRVRTNPLMYFQPTSWTVLSAAQQQLEQYQESGVNWRVSQRCCDHLATLSAGGCLCNPETVSFLSSITGEAFLDAVRGSYRDSCLGLGTLALYPSADC